MRTVNQDTPHGDLQAIAKELRDQKRLFCAIEPHLTSDGYLEWSGTFCRTDKVTNGVFLKFLQHTVICETYEEALQKTINNILSLYKIDLDSLFE